MKLLADNLSSHIEYSLKSESFDNPAEASGKSSMKSRRLLMTTLILTGMLSLFALYLGIRFHLWSMEVGFSPVISWTALFACVFLQGFGHYSNGQKTRRTFLSHTLTWLTQLLFGSFICLLIYTVLFDVAGVFARFFLSAQAQNHFELFSFYAILSLTALTVVGGFLQAQVIGPRLYQTEIPLENLPTAFDGFKIAQISDLHVGPTIDHRYVESVVQRINALNPDLIVITGDVIDGPVTLLKDDVQPLSELRAKHGAYVITGNHEYYWNALDWVHEYRKIGLRPLLNEHVVIQENLHSLVLGGVTDYFAERMLPAHTHDIKKTFAQAPPDVPKILLVHQPVLAKLAEENGVALQISGHTHGGQFFPGNIIVRLAQKYLKGLHRYRKMWIYVSRGTGYWGPPLRFLVPSEITLLTLRKF